MSSIPENQYPQAGFKRWALATAAACLLGGLSFPVMSSALWVEPLHTQEEHIDTPSTKSLQMKRTVRAATVTLEPLTDSVSTKANSTPSQGNTFAAPLQIGNGRSVLETEDSQSFAGLLQWELLSDGRQVAAVEFISPGAVGNRLILSVEKLDPRAQLNFSGDAPSAAVTLTGFEVLDSIFRDNPGSANGLIDKRFTGPYMDGESTLLEIILPKGVEPEGLKLAVPSLSHIVVSPVESNPWRKNVGSSGSCNVDSTCRPEWEPVSKGVARMLFSEPSSGDSFLCTGSLLNDTSNSGTPYFLTANHCLSTQSVASTLQTFWFYHSTSCNSGILDPRNQTRTGGATLLFTQSLTDTTLLRLNSAPPSGASFLGWTTALPSVGQSMAAVHHPAGDTAKVSLANLARYANCNETQCISGLPSNTTYLTVSWSSGVVEPGSSGSGLFWPNSGERYLVGQLLGGNSSCSNPNGVDFYGRFDLAFEAGMHEFLNPVLGGPGEPGNPLPPPAEPGEPFRTPVYRFYNTQSNAHFFTASAGERDFVIATYGSFIYEGVAFYAYPASEPNLSPVYRFYNEATGSHFYTISQAERDIVIELYPSYIYEDAAWGARTTPGDGSLPLYRFYNTATSSHFYTMSAAERDNVIDRFATYIYEGVAYYTWPSP